MTEKTIMANGLELVYEEFGSRNKPVILLIMGLGTQMTAWPEEFCLSLANAGYRVIRYDNRDIGLSQKFSRSPVPNILKLTILTKIGLPFKVSYTLQDMADDALALLDSLKIDKAHVVGASMGGMIGQLTSAKAPERISTFTSIMSSSGRRRVPSAKPEIIKQMLKPAGTSKEAAIAQRMKVLELIGSIGPLKSRQDELRDKVTQSYERSVYPEGYLRHLAAIMHCGSRVKQLKSISVPTLVIHGKADPLIPVQGGIDTARLIEGSRLELIEDMGHDLPKKLIPTLSSLITEHIERHAPA